MRWIRFAKHFPVPERRYEPASSRIALLVYHGEPLILPGGEVKSLVVGLQHGPTLTERRGLQAGLHIELTPLEAFRIFAMPPSELTDRAVHLDELVEGRRRAEGPEPAPVVDWMWRKLAESRGKARIEALVAESGYSHRFVARRFQQQVGMTPKAYARVLRFEHAMRLLRRADLTLAEVASGAGYYDQAHLSGQFRELAGVTPGEWRSSFSKTGCGGAA